MSSGGVRADPSALDEPLARPLPWAWLAAIFAVAAGLRLLVAAQLSRTVLYQLPQLDAMEFLRWAERIAAGDFSYPEYPTHGPAYPYFLALLLKLFGGSLAAVRAAQAMVGGLTCVLAAQIGARFWGRAAGLGVGLLLAVHGPLVLAETALWEEVVLMLALVGSWWVFTHPASRLPTRIWIAAPAAGALLGVAVLVRPTPLVLLPIFLALPWIERWPRPGRAAALLALTTTLVIAPAVVAASRAAGTFLFLRGFGSINLYIGNDPAGGGIQNARLGGDWDRLESAPYRDGVTAIGDLEGYYTAKTLERIGEDPLGFAGVLASKLAWLTQNEEPRDNHSYVFFKENSSVLRLLPGFGLQWGLFLAGLWVAWRHWRGAGMPRRGLPWIVLASGLLLGLVAVATLMGMRYRLPVVPAMAIFGGLGAATLWDAARARRPRQLAGLGGVVVVAFLLSLLRTHPPTHVLAEEWALTGSSLQAAERLDEAEDAFRRAAELDPTSALGWDGLGRTAFSRGNAAAAQPLFAKATEVDPDYRRAHYHLALTRKNLGDVDGAVDSLRRAVEIAPRYLLAQAELAPLLLQRGDLDGAAEAWRWVLEVDPGRADAHLGLARIAGAQGRPADGVAHARQAATRGGALEAWMLVGFLGADAGDPAAVEEAVDRLESAGQGEAPQTRLLRATRLALLGEHEAALDITRRLLIEQPRMQPAAQLLLRSAEAVGQRPQAEDFLRRLWNRG